MKWIVAILLVTGTVLGSGCAKEKEKPAAAVEKESHDGHDRDDKSDHSGHDH